jgi:hypothetical protein
MMFDSTSQAVKVASILVHVKEATSSKGHAFDAVALAVLIQDPEVQAWLAKFPSVFLPVIR